MTSLPRTGLDPDEISRLELLEKCLRKARRGLRHLSDEEIEALPRLYRHAASVTARLESTGVSPRAASSARRLYTRAHALLGRERFDATDRIRELGRFFLVEAPRVIRAEWALLAFTFALIYGLALLAWFGVTRDLDLAYSLLDAGVVQDEIRQLQETPAGEPFRGNFDFGLGESATTAGWIMMNNMQVGMMYFASALVPPLFVYIAGTNGLMLGTYLGVAGHWDQAGAILSILACHGVIEIQTIVLAGTAGLLLVRSILRPGARTRRGALRQGGRRALAILGPVFPLLVIAGLIEGFVSPHAPFGVRMAVAAGTGVALLAWVFASDRAFSFLER